MPQAVTTRATVQKPVRAAQTLVSHMGYCRQHASLAALEVAWRWLVGIPFLLVAWREAQRILAQIPASAAGLDKLEWQNPWTSSVMLDQAIGQYAPLVAHALLWLVPAGIVAWSVGSAAGRIAIVRRMSAIDARNDGRTARLPGWRKLPGMALLQGIWMTALCGCLWLWYRSVGWAAAAHLRVGVQPDLIGYLCWLIFFSLALYVLWAMTSWVLAMAPLLYLREDGGIATALGRSFQLGREFSGKLAEVNLVMAIVKIALIVLAMVFSAAPLPFSDEFGTGFMHGLYAVIAVWFLVANDYFQVVRLRSFVVLWDHYRASMRLEFASSVLIDSYPGLQVEFMRQILDKEQWFVSDESSLWDFTMDQSLEPYYLKIRQIYGVDVSDVHGALISKILQRIAGQRSRSC